MYIIHQNYIYYTDTHIHRYLEAKEDKNKDVAYKITRKPQINSNQSEVGEMCHLKAMAFSGVLVVLKTVFLLKTQQY